MAEIRGILFDKDGTLFDFHATWGAWAQGFLSDLSQGDAGRAQALGQAIGFDHSAGVFAPDSPVIAGTPGDIAAFLLPHLPGTSPDVLIAQMNRAAAAAPMKEAVPLAPMLDGLRGMGLALGVATNDTEAPARAHLAAAGVAGRFDFIAGSDSGHGAKPAPGQLLAFADAAGLAPASVLMIGDSRHDLTAGRAAGMGTVGVLTGPATARDLADLADAVLPDIGHLGAYLTARMR